MNARNLTVCQPLVDVLEVILLYAWLEVDTASLDFCDSYDIPAVVLVIKILIGKDANEISLFLVTIWLLSSY